MTEDKKVKCEIPLLKYDEVDLDGDIFVSGCMKIPKDKRIVILKNFDHSCPVGYADGFESTDDGVAITGFAFMSDVTRPDDFEFRMGFSVEEMEFDEEEKTRTIKKAHLWSIGITPKKEKGE